MASYVTPKKNATFITYVSLEDQANAGLFKASPTLAAGDFKVSIDGGALNNLTDLPTVTPSGGRMVKITLTAPEMNGDNITVVASDASGAEWYDLLINIQTTARQVDDLAATGADGDTLETLSDQIDATATAAALATVDGIVDDLLAVAPDNKPAVAATGEAAVNVTLWKDATAPAMTGDAFARLGAPAGASVSADIAAIAAASAAGSGAISFPVTINDESSNPIDGVEVWVSTDSAGASVVAGTLHTSALGVATFMLDAGTYYLWRQKSGYNFTNPVTITVS